MVFTQFIVHSRSVTKQDNVDRDHSFSISILNVLISFLMLQLCENFFF